MGEDGQSDAEAQPEPSMTAPIPPALSAEEWAKRVIEVSPNVAMHEDRDGWLSLSAFGHGEDVEARHAVAALALHGQDFGFTREDVDAVARAAAEIQSNLSRIPTDIASSFTATQSYAHYDAGMRHSRDAAILRSLAARINALLPPEGT